MADTDTIEPFTIDLPAADLPEAIVARFPQRPAPDTRFTITVEPALTDEEKLEALRRDIDLGLADLEAGRIIEGADLFAELRRQHARSGV